MSDSDKKTVTEQPGRLQKLLDRRDQLQQRIRRIASAEKAEERKRRNRRMLLWGVVVEAALKRGEIEGAEWADVCRRTLTKAAELDAAIETLPPQQS